METPGGGGGEVRKEGAGVVSPAVTEGREKEKSNGRPAVLKALSVDESNKDKDKNNSRRSRRRASGAGVQSEQQHKDKKEAEDRKGGDSRSGSHGRRRNSGNVKDAVAGGKQRGGANRANWRDQRSAGSTVERQISAQSTGSAVSEKPQKQRTRSANSTGSTSSQKRAAKGSSNSVTSNGEGYEYSDEYEELDEPFSSDEEDDITRGPQKMSLVIPRGRIRTLSGTVPVVGFSPKWGGPTMCLSCLRFFDLPDQMQSFGEHLLQEHHIVVTEMDLIVDPKRYIEHWRKRFAKESVDHIFPRIEPQEGDPLHGKTSFYFEMSERLPEDYSLRQRLAMRRLEEALSCQQREREDTAFSQQCIFCRYTARGNRSKIIHHLYMIHHLNLGSPDNLVFVTEYIEHLKEKLSRNECIYCEKTFADRNILMDHMRKRNHREVNPKNHYYDKFYIINYLELGKRWLDVLAEDFEDSMPTFVDSDEEEEEDSWCEWQEDNVDADETRGVCLFCDESFEKAELLLTHMTEAHRFDFLKYIEEEKLELYDRMKLINYIRKQNYNAMCFLCSKDFVGNFVGLRKHVTEEEDLSKGLPEANRWREGDEHLVTLYGNDHFLWMLESFLEEKESEKNPGAHGCLLGCPSKEKSAKDPKKLVEELVRESQASTVEGVVAEDLPPLESFNNNELAELI